MTGLPGLAHQTRAPTLRYQQVDLASRIEGATPHALVTLLYGELATALDVLARAAAQGDRARLLQHHARASAILRSLEAGLDRANGGALALSLADIYRQMGRRLLAARNADRTAIAEVKAGVVSLAEAWSRIGG